MISFDMQILVIAGLTLLVMVILFWITKNTLSMGIVLGLVLVKAGLLRLITDAPSLWKGLFPVPVWTAWVSIPVGIIVIVMSIRGILRGEGKSKRPTDEDVARAKADLERIYLRDHGELPKPPEDGK